MRKPHYPTREVKAAASLTVGTLVAFATYALGFAVRPIGGAVFGHLGDKVGRKAILVTTLMVMGITTPLSARFPPMARLARSHPSCSLCFG